VYIALRILTTMPITVAAGERSGRREELL